MSDTDIMQRIIWLASYPKSGNTWLRAFLANLQSKQDEPVDINNLGGGPIASSRFVFDEAIGIEASDLTRAEIERYRPAVYEHITTLSEETVFLKIHDAFTYSDVGTPIVSRAATKGVIYLIRNPLDVAVSYAHHMGLSIEKTIKMMGHDSHTLAGTQRGISHQLRQLLLSWSGHVQSWIDDSGLPMHVMRYEDMFYNPIETFTSVAQFVELPADPAAIEQALTFSSFDVLQSQERDRGFAEKPMKANSFFRRGKVGGWREEINEEQVAQIVQDHGHVMRRFGYLTDFNILVY